MIIVLGVLFGAMACGKLRARARRDWLSRLESLDSDDSRFCAPSHLLSTPVEAISLR
jgi:hypothetical protein